MIVYPHRTGFRIEYLTIRYLSTIHRFCHNKLFPDHDFSLVWVFLWVLLWCVCVNETKWNPIQDARKRGRCWVRPDSSEKEIVACADAAACMATRLKVQNILVRNVVKYPSRKNLSSFHRGRVLERDSLLLERSLMWGRIFSAQKRFSRFLLLVGNHIFWSSRTSFF